MSSSGSASRQQENDFLSSTLSLTNTALQEFYERDSQPQQGHPPAEGSAQHPRQHSRHAICLRGPDPALPAPVEPERDLVQHQISLHEALSLTSKDQGAEGEEGEEDSPFAWLPLLPPAPGTFPRHAETVPDKDLCQGQQLAIPQSQGPALPSGLLPITSGSAWSCELQEKKQGSTAAPQQAEVESASFEPQVASKARNEHSPLNWASGYKFNSP